MIRYLALMMTGLMMTTVVAVMMTMSEEGEDR
jgi:hypothetical protein